MQQLCLRTSVSVSRMQLTSFSLLTGSRVAEAPRARAAPKVPILLSRKKPSIGIKPLAGKGAGGKATAAGGALKERARKAAVKKTVKGQVDNPAVEANDHQTADRRTAEEPAPDQPAAAALQQRGTAQGIKRKAAQLLREDKPAENKNAAKAAESPIDGGQLPP